MSRKMGDTNNPERDAATTEGEESRARPGRRSVEDRQAAVLDLLAGKATLEQLARRYGVHADTVAAWRDEALGGIREALSKGAKSAKERELERENRQLRGAVTEGAIREAILKRELEAARGSHPTKPEKSRR